MTDQGAADGPPSDEPLFRCRAVLRESGEPRAPSSAHLAVYALLGMAALAILLPLVFSLSRGPENWCCATIPLLVVLVAGNTFLQFLRPRRRGWLELWPDRLRFEPWVGEARELPLVHIADVLRRGWRIELVLKAPRWRWLGFRCSRLHGEDLFDQLVARLEELGIEFTSHERSD